MQSSGGHEGIIKSLRLQESLWYEAVSGWGPGFDLFEDKSPSAFLKMTYDEVWVLPYIPVHEEGQTQLIDSFKET